MKNKIWDNKVFQVAIPTYNNAKTIGRCLKSVNECLLNEEWHLVVGDNGSTDDTISIIKDRLEHLSCQSHLILEYPKAKNSAEAKNRVLNICGSFARERPAVLGLDACNIMLKDRIKLYDQAKEQKSCFLIAGSWCFSSEADHKKKKYQYKVISNCIKDLELTWDSTLMHADIIPGNGSLFDERINIYEDLILWQKIMLLPSKIEIAIADETLDEVNLKIIDHEKHFLSKEINEEDSIKALWEAIETLKLQKIGIEQQPPPNLPVPESTPEGVVVTDGTIKK